MIYVDLSYLISKRGLCHSQVYYILSFFSLFHLNFSLHSTQMWKHQFGKVGQFVDSEMPLLSGISHWLGSKLEDFKAKSLKYFPDPFSL